MATPVLTDQKVSRKDEAEYFKEAASWDDDRVIYLRKSKRTGWIVAGAEFFLIVMLLLALLIMLPLKRTELRVFRVDSTSGIVDEVVRLSNARETYDEAMTKYFLGRVVSLRETYTRAQLQSNYDQSVLFTAPEARPQLKADFSFDNPNGPYKRYGEKGTSSIQIETLSFVAKNVAQIRYVRTDHKGGADIQTHWIATIEFRYVSQPASETARQVNPLGFQVTNYRNDPEAIAEVIKP